MVADKQSISQAARLFASSLPPGKHQDSQEALRFARWFGEERSTDELRPVDIESYVESFGINSPNATSRADSLKTFLAFAHKQNLTRERLVSHVRVRRAGVRRNQANSVEANNEVRITPEGKLALEAELEELKAQRPRVAEELRHARADGDVRENAPLEAAREAQGRIEARIRELENMLRLAVVVENEDRSSDVAKVGCSVKISNLSTGAEMSYQIVNSAEARPGTGRLSAESPVGKAVVGKRVGDVVEVAAPSGTIRFRIDSIEV